MLVDVRLMNIIQIKDLEKVVISCDCEPFKYKNNITIYNLVEGTNTVSNSRMTVYADLINESEVTINSKVYSAGTHLSSNKAYKWHKYLKFKWYRYS